MTSRYDKCSKICPLSKGRKPCIIQCQMEQGCMYDEDDGQYQHEETYGDR